MRTIARIIIVAMVLLFVGIITYASIRNMDRDTQAELDAAASTESTVSESEAAEESLDAGSEGDTSDLTAAQISKATQLESSDFEAVDVSSQIKTIDDIDEDAEDNAINDTEQEVEYVNSLALLPSIWNQREKVDKSKVDTSGFPDSYALTATKTLEIGDATVTIPREVYLYNSGIEKSSEYEVTAEIDGNTETIQSIGWASMDSSKVAVSKGAGKRTVVSSVDPSFSGVITISVFITYSPEKGVTSTEETSFTVRVEKISYGNEVLKDKDGESLYLDQAGKTLAHVSDYGTAECFYGAVKTTGWQNIDGHKYYFDSNSQMVTGKQIIGGMPYVFDDNGILEEDEPLTIGIDVSKYQKTIDWQQVAASGVSFAIIRCGFRGSATGTLVEDPYFRQNVEGATAAGIKVGVYFFTQAITEQEAIEEASMAIQMCQGYNIDLPIYIDSEGATNGRANNLDRALRTRCLKAFCETINANGYVGGVYASKSWYNRKVYAQELEQYNIWVAQYNTECNYLGKTNFWQYSSHEYVAGIVGRVDMDIVRESDAHWD